MGFKTSMPGLLTSTFVEHLQTSHVGEGEPALPGCLNKQDRMKRRIQLSQRLPEETSGANRSKTAVSKEIVDLGETSWLRKRRKEINVLWNSDSILVRG